MLTDCMLGEALGTISSLCCNKQVLSLPVKLQLQQHKMICPMHGMPSQLRTLVGKQGVPHCVLLLEM